MNIVLAVIYSNYKKHLKVGRETDWVDNGGGG